MRWSQNSENEFENFLYVGRQQQNKGAVAKRPPAAGKVEHSNETEKVVCFQCVEGGEKCIIPRFFLLSWPLPKAFIPVQPFFFSPSIFISLSFISDAIMSTADVATSFVACSMCEAPLKKKFVCGKCKAAKYCGRECQKRHWKAHKFICGQDLNDMDDSEIAMTVGKTRFQEIIIKYGLNHESKADAIAEYCTAAEVSVVEFSNKFGMRPDEAKAFLSFINIGVKFKEEVMDKNRDNQALLNQLSGK